MTPVVSKTTHVVEGLMLAVNEASVPLEAFAYPTTEDRAVELLGGRASLGLPPAGSVDVHTLLMHGLPGAALTCLMQGLEGRHDAAALENAIGVGLRTLQRRRLEPDKRLSVEQSGQVWMFAEVLARAEAVFGSRAEAEAWLERPAIGLDQRRPIDLLATRAGARLVEDHLERLEFGVYA